MVDTLRKLLLAGLGALDMTEEKAKAKEFFEALIAKDYAKAGRQTPITLTNDLPPVPRGFDSPERAE